MSTVPNTRSAVRRAALVKSGSLATDYLATIPTTVATGVPLLGLPVSVASTGGSIAGLVAAPKTKHNPETDAMSVVPGVAQYRLMQRYRRVMDESNRRRAHGTANTVAEQLGGISGTLVGGGLGAAAGGGIGALAGGRDAAGSGALIGGIAGLTLPTIIGGIVAGIRRKRTLGEQAAADTTGRAVAKYLVPGLSTYDSLKRLGASTHLDKSKKEKKAAEAAYVEGFCKAAEAAGIDPVALYKKAAPLGPAVDPRHIAALSLLLGGAAGGSAITGGDQSALSRLGRGALGAGLTYAGYKTLTDPRWQRAVGQGTQRAIDYGRQGIAYLRSLLGRGAGAAAPTATAS